MKSIVTLAITLTLGTSCSTVTELAPVITNQQLQCLNKPKEFVQQAITANKQTFVGQEQGVFLVKTTDGRLLGYLFEQGECSTVMTHIPANGLAQAEAFIAAEVKKNFGPMFRTSDNVSYKYYTAPIGQNADTYLVAQALN
ncbi:hypothetical protein [Hymenobacter rigui]|uniref:Uncharacterized protein n=1 Tax=Hymenobacter rigui TaxID=334424 RepID=A0A428KM17_9BACT|nr:hypothetical protein [Hymenobacter rigui]RSK47492.1 hypothetical protein EI291_14635 [Hymenobacter rigui]